jgi:hypothetical protein
MHNIWAYIIVFGSIIIGSIISALWKYRKRKQGNKYWEKLKKEGKPIQVHLKDIDIKTNEYNETPVHDSIPSRIEMLDGLSRSGGADGTIKKAVSVLLYRYKKPNGELVMFRSETIEMPIESLRLRMEHINETTIYVDENNWNRYYFDIEFLEE